MPGIWMPTGKQLKTIYKNVVQQRADDDKLSKMAVPPKGKESMAKYKNVGIKGIEGREDIYTNGNELYVRNRTKDGKESWFDAGPAPMFMGPPRANY